MPPPRQLRREDYTVGWICALPIELAAAQEMLDETHDDLDSLPDDPNIYSLGSIAGHNVVIGCLPAGRIGTTPATSVAIRMQTAFNNLRLRLMVGIGGGVPSAVADVRLGDVVVSEPNRTSSGVVQYDYGKTTTMGFEKAGALPSPPQILLGALNVMKARQRNARFYEHLAKLADRRPEFHRDMAGPDILFKATYDHQREAESCHLCCDLNEQEHRSARESENEMQFHYGTIASGNQVIKNARMRDKICNQFGDVLCFEMEAAGLMNDFPCLVIRGICDYADSHKNKTWQPFAAATAAAFAKEVLLAVPPIRNVRASQPTSSGSNPSISSVHSIPFPKNRSFVGREAALEELTDKLLVKRICEKMTISGLGGTGKTQVALQFAYNVKENHPDYSVFWVPALSIASFDKAYVDIGRRLKLPQLEDKREDAKEAVKGYLSSQRAGKWLLVVDNVDDYDIVFGNRSSGGINSLLPRSEEGIILFTTRTLQVATSLTRQNVIKLGAMSEIEAVDFLQASLIDRQTIRRQQSTTELLEQLAYLPLAITQAAAYLNMHETSISQYLRLLRDTTEEDIIRLMSEEFHDETRYEDTDNAVATTWVVSFRQIQARSVAAANLLAFMACIEWKAIPRSILPKEQTEADTERAIGILRSYAFIKQGTEDDMYDMHRLVHFATRIWTIQHDSIEDKTQEAVRHLAQVLPWGTWESRILWRKYLPHALQVLDNHQYSDVEDKALLCLKVGRCLDIDGRHSERVKWLEECHKLRKRLNETHPDRLQSEHGLGSAYIDTRQTKQAIDLLEHVAAIRQETLAEEHLYTLNIKHELARAYLQDGQTEKAVKLLEYGAAFRQRTLAEEHPNRLIIQHELARAYLQDRQVEKAVKLLEHVASVRQRTLAEEHPDRLTAQHELARTYLQDGQVEKAVKLLEHVASVRQRTLAEEHPDRLTTQHELARTYLQDGQVEKAVKLLEHVAAVRQRTLAEEHSYRLTTQHILAEAYLQDKQVEKAVKLLEHIAVVRQRTLAEEHPYRLTAQHMLARAYLQDRQVEKAVELFEHVAKIESLNSQYSHSERLVSKHWLAHAYHADGQLEKAIEMLGHVVAIEAETLNVGDSERRRHEARLQKWREELARTGV